MLKLFYLSLVILPIYVFGNYDTLVLKSKITDVTVFFNGAQISRQIKLKTTKGKHLIVVDNLPSELHPQSIQVKGVEFCKILSVKHQLIYPTDNKKNKSELDLENKIEEQKTKIKEIKNKINVFEIEEKILLDNSVFNKNNSGSSISEIKEATEFYRSKLNEIKQNKLNLSKDLENLDKKIQELYVQINEVASSRNKTISQLIFIIDCEKEINSAIYLNYYISSAGWTPSYDFRVEDISKPLSINYNANVFQSTGENWEDIKIKLSTNNPTLSGYKPELPNWYLDRKNSSKAKKQANTGPSAIKGRVLDAKTNESLAFVKISILKDNQVISGAVTDIDGQYLIKPIEAGNYDVKVAYVGYQDLLYKNMTLFADKINFQDFKLNANEIELEEINVTTYKVPLIAKDGGASGATIRREEISRLPVRGSYNVVASTVKGSRSDDSYYYADGVRVSESSIEINNIISNSLKTNISNLEYELDIPYSVPSDGIDYSLKIKEVTLPVKYKHYAVPKLDNCAFLTAEIVNWDELNLLAAKSNIYYQGTYVGETYIDTELASDTLKISLGRDKNIVIQRELNKELFDKKFVGANIKETISWNITVRNNKSSKVNLIIEDQFPISEKKSIEIDKIEFTSGKVNEKTGKITWDLELEPQNKKVISFKYSVKYPKNTAILID